MRFINLFRKKTNLMTAMEEEKETEQSTQYLTQQPKEQLTEAERRKRLIFEILGDIDYVIDELDMKFVFGITEYWKVDCVVRVLHEVRSKCYWLLEKEE